MALLSWHSGRRGFVGFLAYITGTDGVSRGGVIPAMTLVNSAGIEAAVGAPAAATTAGTAYDARNYGAATAQISGLSGGDTIAFTQSIDGTIYVAVSWIDQGFGSGGASPYTISANGIYSFPGGGYLKWVKTGVASTPAVTVRAAS